MNLCECGCGKPAPIAKVTRLARGHVRGQPLRFINGHNARTRLITEDTRKRLVEAWRRRPEVQIQDPKERFYSKVSKGSTDECWLWNGKVNNRGYGMFTIRGKHILAHRFSYETANGAIPNGCVLDHLCRTPRCVNPAHLEAVTQKINAYRSHGFGKFKTHCLKGHPYTKANTILRQPQGWRQCRICTQETDKLRVRHRRKGDAHGHQSVSK